MQESIISYKKLVEGKQYIIDQLNDDKIKTFYKGTFREEYPNLIFVECVRRDINIDSSYYIMNLGQYKSFGFS